MHCYCLYRMGCLLLSTMLLLCPQRKLLWEMKDEIVEPFGEKAIQVFARISALRDRLDGPQADDQVNTGNESVSAVNMCVKPALYCDISQKRKRSYPA